MDMKETVIQGIKAALAAAVSAGDLPDGEYPDVLLEVPPQKEFGDFATNIAMQSARIAHKSPRMIADILLKHLDAPWLEKAEVAGAGFINFFLKHDIIYDTLCHILEQGKQYGKAPLRAEDTVQVEYVSANPTGPLHVGHGRGAAYGSALVNLLRAAGYNVQSEYYINDAGNQMNNLAASVNARYLELLGKKAEIPENGYHGADIIDTARAIIEQDGALWLKSTAYGDDKDRVVIRDNGVPTYLAADIAYHKNKYERQFKKLINIWGADHHGYVARVKAAMAALGLDPNQLEILLLQMVSLFRNGELVKMSKRTGQAITLNELIEEVGTDAARYFFIMRSLDTQLDFDLDLAKSHSNENPVYYIQYANARIFSIYKQIAENGDVFDMTWKNTKWDKLKEERELALIKKMAAYPEEIRKAAAERAPHRIAHFVYEMAGLFHAFYNNCHIIQSDKELEEARLALVTAVQITIANCLAVLGISAPETM